MEEVSIKKFKIQRLEKMRIDPNCGPPTIAVIGKRNTGKCLAQGTRVIMYNGNLKKVEDVKVGDLLMGPDSLPRKVESLATGKELLYKIFQEPYGKNYLVNASHIMTIYIDGIVKDIPVKHAVKMKKVYGVKAPRIEFKNSKCKIQDAYRRGKFYDLSQQIPKEILLARSHTRLQYLYGILDRHTTQEKKSENITCNYRFTQLITEPLRNLANSLGFYADKYTIRVSNKTNYYPISIKPHKFGKYG